MQPRLTLHIGTPKSGTTYVQAVIVAGRRDLERAGVLYPGEQYLPRKGFNHQPAVYAVGHRFIRWVGPEARENAVGYYRRLCEEVTAHDAHVLISAESLAFFDPGEIRTFLAGLDADPRLTDVVITARDLGRVLPSIWQQNVKNGSVEPLSDYLASVAALRDVPDVPLWTAFGLPGLVRRWQDVVGADRVSLVTAPHRGGEELWRRFAVAARLPVSIGAGTRSRGTELDLADHNLSLTQDQADLLLRMNVLLRTHTEDPEAGRRLRRRVLRTWMDAGDGRGSRIAVPERLRATVERWAEEDADALLRAGVHVVGDLADLLPRASSFEDLPSTCSTADDLDTAARALLLEVDRPAPPRHRWRSALGRLRRRMAAAATPRAAGSAASPEPTDEAKGRAGQVVLGDDPVAAGADAAAAGGGAVRNRSH